MDTYFKDCLYLTCAVCNDADCMEVSFEEPRWRKEWPHHDVSDPEVSDKVDFSLNIDYGSYSWRQRLRHVWRVLRGRQCSDNVVSLSEEQASLLAWRLRHWVMRGDASRLGDVQLPPGTRGESRVF